MATDPRLVKDLASVLDVTGTFAFALSGATAGVRRRLDLFGVLVLSFAAATSGGIARDMLIGAVPPAALTELRYLALSLAAGLVTFGFYSVVSMHRNPVQVFDAAGLSLFAVAGAQKALAYGLHPVMAALLGMITGIGGGIARDLLLAEIPAVLRSDIYAVAALSGAGVVASGAVLELPLVPTMFVGAILCFSLRLVALRRGWQLPTARAPEPPPPTGPS